MAETGKNPERRHTANIPVFGVMLTAASIILLLNTLDVLPWDVWRELWRLWPVLLILAGVKFVIPSMHPLVVFLLSIITVGVVLGFAFYVAEDDRFSTDFEAFEYELVRGTATSLDLDLDFGAGELNILPLPADDTRLVVAELFDDKNHVDIDESMSGSTRELTIRLESSGFLFFGGGGDGREWTLRINPAIPTTINIDGGAGQFVLDFEDTLVQGFDINVGAVDLDLTAPANAGHVDGTIDAGAADITVRVPDGVAARIDTDTGVSSVNIDSDRFPKTGNVNASTDYSTATNRLDLSIDAGASSITVR